MDVRRLPLAMAAAWVARVSYTGDLGYEIWCDPAVQLHLFETIMREGSELGLLLFGTRALNSLRLEKAYGSWAREYRPIYGPFEAGLDRFVDFKKSHFIGRSAAAEEKESGGALRLVTFKVDATDADAIGDEPIWHDGKAVGWVTSGAFGHRVNHSLALGYVPAVQAAADAGFEIEIIGERHKAHRLAGASFDPAGGLMRT